MNVRKLNNLKEKFKDLQMIILTKYKNKRRKLTVLEKLTVNWNLRMENCKMKSRFYNKNYCKLKELLIQHIRLLSKVNNLKQMIKILNHAILSVTQVNLKFKCQLLKKEIAQQLVL